MASLEPLLIKVLTILFHIFGILGVFIGMALLTVPDHVQRLEEYLGKKLTAAAGSEGLGDTLDRHRNMEYLFFNHHILCGLSLILFPAILLVLLQDLPRPATDLLVEFHTPMWVLFMKEILYPTLVALVTWVSVFSILFGALLIVLPHHAFRLLRTLNHNYPTGELTQALQEDIPLNRVFYRYAPLFGALFIILSFFLLLMLRIL